MSNIATNFLGFIIVLGFLIFAHESGHFLMAKLFRVRVLVFSFGFGKRLFGFRKGDTDYRVSLVPLGGYVRMAGDTPEENQPADPTEFLSKPKWQRFVILVAGPFMNVLIAILFVAGINMVGTEILVIKPVIGEISAGKAAAKAGLAVGDRITRVAGETIREWEDLRLAVSMRPATAVAVEYVRAGTPHTTTLTPEKESTEYGVVGRAGIKPMLDPIIGRVKPGSPADKSGLKAGDRIVSASGHPVTQYGDFETAMTAAKKIPFPFEVLRGNQRVTLTFPSIGPDDAPGFIPPTEMHKLSLIPALRESVDQNWKMLKYAGAALGRLFRAQGSVKELSGPISIARISGDMLRRGWMEVIMLMASISLQLGMMNLLPIPVLDGGHIFILLVEGVARRDLSMRVKERIQQLGFAALAALMLVVLYNDVISNVMLMRKG